MTSQIPDHFKTQDMCIEVIQKYSFLWADVQKFGQKEAITKGFYGQRQITDIFTIDVNELVVFDKVPCNNGKTIVIL